MTALTTAELRKVVAGASKESKVQRAAALAILRAHIYDTLIQAARRAGITPDLSRPKTDPLTLAQWTQLEDWLGARP